MILYVNSGDPNQTTLFVLSDLGLHCLPMTHRMEAICIIYVLKNPLS